MSDTADDYAHVSDQDIDLYFRRQLPEDRARAFEEHYLECAGCLARVEQVEALIEGLGDPVRAVQVGPAGRAWWFAPAAASAAGLVLGWLLHDISSPANPAPTALPGSLASTAPAAGRASAVAEFTLQPAIQNAAGETLRPPAGTSVVLLHVDAGEAGAPGSTFEVRLIDKGGQALLTLRALRSNREGKVSLAIPAALLGPGQYSIQVRRDAVTLDIPFHVEPEP